jgi:uroporphyrinogen-III synthase
MSAGSILVVRDDDSFADSLREAGLVVETLPLIFTRPLSDQTGLQAELLRLDSYDGIFFTSVAAVEAVLLTGTAELRRFSGGIYVVGERSRKMLDNAGIAVQAEAANSAEELISSLGVSQLEGKRFLYFCGDRRLPTIPAMLEKLADLNEVVVYQTVERPLPAARAEQTKRLLSAGDASWVCFFSPSGVDAFRRLVGEEVDGQLKAAAIGSTTAKRASDLGFRVAFISSQPSLRPFAQGLISRINGS